MSPVAYARQVPTAPAVSRGVARLVVFVAAWWAVLAVTAAGGRW
ncbi:hypothetical protein [Aeromicrobium erythreum]|nr:hypothetical protein [Aeromicrobium erythreum]